MYAILQKGEFGKIEFSNSPRQSVLAYIEKSQKILDKIISPIQSSQEPLTLWGIGASTTILLNAFEGCNVKQLIDRNEKRQGMEFTINGKSLRIEGPEAVGKDNTIVILSIPYHASIERQIREMGLQNKIVSIE